MNGTSLLSRSFKFILACALMLPLVELSKAPALAQGLEFWNKNCQKEYKKWKSTAKHRAFAVSNSNAGAGDGQACGWASGYSTTSAAESSAIKSCEAEKSYRSGRCYVMKSE